MDRIWAPWRMEYILNENPEAGCIFCNRIGRNEDQKDLILFRGSTAFVIMNKFPYNNGHLMVVPNRHIANPTNLDEREMVELFRLLNLSIRVLNQTMNPHGFNVGMNLGRVAGAGVEDHLHFHIVPRWNGDTNFMPVISETKVISESLEKSYEKLKDVFEKLSGETE